MTSAAPFAGAFPLAAGTGSEEPESICYILGLFSDTIVVGH